jgi:glycosyltransferase involved in cell wall biosynthesis
MLFTNATARGGAEEHMLTLLHGIDRARFRLHLVCPPDVAAKLQPDLPSDVESIPLRLDRVKPFREAIRFGRLLRSRRIQILHVHRFYSSVFAAPVAALCRVPVTIETPHLSERWRRGWFSSRFLVDRIVGTLVDRYIAVSEANAAYLSDEKGLPRNKITVIRNGCDLERFDPLHRPPERLKASLGLCESDRVLLISARLEQQKGHSVLLQAMPRVLNQFPNVRVLCLGDGSLRGELESRASFLGLGRNVRFLGHRSNMADFLALSEFTVLPSLWEGLPLTAIESLAAGRAVVATSVDGTPEVVVDGMTGITVPAGDPEKLARAMLTLLQYPKLAKKMGQVGRDWAVKNFSQERQIQETQEVYFQSLERYESRRAVSTPATEGKDAVRVAGAKANR